MVFWENKQRCTQYIAARLETEMRSYALCNHVRCQNTCQKGSESPPNSLIYRLTSRNLPRRKSYRTFFTPLESVSRLPMSL